MKHFLVFWWADAGDVFWYVSSTTHGRLGISPILHEIMMIMMVDNFSWLRRWRGGRCRRRCCTCCACHYKNSVCIDNISSNITTVIIKQCDSKLLCWINWNYWNACEATLYDFWRTRRFLLLIKFKSLNIISIIFHLIHFLYKLNDCI